LNMKTFIVSSVLSALIGIASVASGQTNEIDVHLEFLSQGTNFTDYVTNTIIHRSGPRTNRVYTTNYVVVTNTVWQAVHQSVTTEDVISAITSNAPPNAKLALVTESPSSNSVVLLVDGTNFLSVSDLTISVINTVFAENEFLTATGTRIEPNSDFPEQTELISAKLVTPTLSFSVTGVTGVSQTAHDHGHGRGDDDGQPNGGAGSGFAVGTGSDSLGTNEIVTGSVTLR
jgi:hypothetical protein